MDRRLGWILAVLIPFFIVAGVQWDPVAQADETIVKEERAEHPVSQNAIQYANKNKTVLADTADSGYDSLQAAHDAARDGGWLYIGRGTWSDTLVVTKQLHITGAGNGTVIKAAGTIIDFQAGSEGSELSHVKLVSTGSGMNLDLSGRTPDAKTTIHHVQFTSAAGATGKAVGVTDAADVAFHHNRWDSIPAGAITVSQTEKIFISDNVFRDYGTRVLSDNSNPEKIHFTDNTVYGSGSTSHAVNLGLVDFAQISGNSIYNAGDAAIQGNDGNYNITGNYIDNPTGSGIEVTDGGNINAASNHILSPGGNGIYFKGDEFGVATGNYIQDAGNHGIRLTQVAPVGEFSITGNVIRGAANEGIEIDGSSADDGVVVGNFVSATGADITTLGDSVLRAANYCATISSDCENVFQGDIRHPTGSSFGILGLFDSGVDKGEHDAINFRNNLSVDTSGSPVIVDASGGGGNTISNLQQGEVLAGDGNFYTTIDLALQNTEKNQTVVIGAGTFAEGQTTIDTAGLRITGMGDSTVLTGSSGDAFVINANDVTIENMVIDWDSNNHIDQDLNSPTRTKYRNITFKGTAQAILLRRGSHVMIENNEFRNGGLGISISVSNVQVRDNFFQGVSGGIDVSGAPVQIVGNYFDLADNTGVKVDNDGRTLIDGNYFDQASITCFANNAEISNNTFIGFGGTAIQACDNFLIAGNYLNNNDRGMGVDADQVVVANNQILNTNGTGIDDKGNASSFVHNLYIGNIIRNSSGNGIETEASPILVGNILEGNSTDYAEIFGGGPVHLAIANLVGDNSLPKEVINNTLDINSNEVQEIGGVHSGSSTTNTDGWDLEVFGDSVPAGRTKPTFSNDSDTYIQIEGPDGAKYLIPAYK